MTKSLKTLIRAWRGGVRIGLVGSGIDGHVSDNEELRGKVFCV